MGCVRYPYLRTVTKNIERDYLRYSTGNTVLYYHIKARTNDERLFVVVARVACHTSFMVEAYALQLRLRGRKLQYRMGSTTRFRVRCIATMRFLCLASALATACAFTSQPAAFTTNSPVVGGRVLDDVVASGQAHRTRKSTIVMDGKANGKST